VQNLAALCFNPRAREERDLTRLAKKLGVMVSIHALVKSATTSTLMYPPVSSVSIHALVKSATQFYRQH